MTATTEDIVQSDVALLLARMFAHSPQLVALGRRGVDAVALARAGELSRAALTELFESPAAPELAAIIARVVEEKWPMTFEATTSAGVVYQLSVNPAPHVSDDSVLMLGMDITERKKLEERLLRSEALMVDAHGVAHMGTWEWDVTEPNARWSTELYRIYGLTPEEYTPSYEGYLTKVHPDDRAYVRAATERVFNEQVPYSHDERILLPNGEIRYLHTWAYPIVDQDGKLVRLLGVCQDISDRKRIETALEDRARELGAANERLLAEMNEREKMELRLREAHKLEAIGRLAGGIAHDFNNLLSVVMGRSGLLQRAVPEGPLRVHATEIADVARQASRLTHQLLVFSREQTTRREVFDWGPVAEELAQILRRLVGEDIDFQARIAATGAILVDADRSQIEQVMMNLVVNARDAMPNGGCLEVELSEHAVEGYDGEIPAELELNGASSFAVLRVTDSGEGMDEAVLARIFDPYFTTKNEGHGLGLSTVYGIVRRSGGALRVRSARAQGSQFTVFLPSALRRAEKARAHHVPLKELRGTANILLVEDQSAVRRMVRAQLEEMGYRVSEAATPADALRDDGSPAQGIELLLTDVVMPELSGTELASKLAALHPEMRVLFMSGWTDKPSLMGMESTGVPLLRKPFTTEELARAIRDVLAAPTSRTR